MRIRFLTTTFLAASVLGTWVAPSTGGEPLAKWTSFQNGGRPVVEHSLPTKWSPDSVAWKSPVVGYGQSTVMVFEGQVFVTSTSGENKEQYHLTTLDLETGEKVWAMQFPNPTPEKNSTYVSRAAPSPVVDASACYAFYEGGLMVAVSHAGEKIWSRDLVAEYGKIEARHGLAASPEQDAERVFVWIERSEDPYILALDKKTGKTAWKVAGLGATTWSSPRLMDIEGQQQLVCSCSGMIAGFDPASGKKLWSFDAVANNTSCSPMPVGDGQFVIGASDGRGEENAGKGSVYNGVIDVSKAADGKWAVDYKWHARRATSSFGSPIVHGSTVYFVNRQGVLYKNDLETGEESRPERLGCGGIWATPLVANNKLYLFGQKGMTSIVDLENGEEIAVNELWEADAKPQTEGTQQPGPPGMGGSVLYAATPAGKYLLLRRGDIVYAIK